MRNSLDINCCATSQSPAISSEAGGGHKNRRRFGFRVVRNSDVFPRPVSMAFDGPKEPRLWLDERIFRLTLEKAVVPVDRSKSGPVWFDLLGHTNSPKIGVLQGNKFNFSSCWSYRDMEILLVAHLQVLEGLWPFAIVPDVQNCPNCTFWRRGSQRTAPSPDTPAATAPVTTTLKFPQKSRNQLISLSGSLLEEA